MQIFFVQIGLALPNQPDREMWLKYKLTNFSRNVFEEEEGEDEPRKAGEG